MAEAGTRASEPRGRGRLSSIDLMPRECEEIIVWAAKELSARERTQVEIYGEFVTRCERLMGEHRGEVEFDIPSFSSFNRYSMRQAIRTRRLDENRQLVAALKDTFDPQASDDLTVIAAESLKSLVFDMLERPDLDPKDTMMLAQALKGAVQASGLSAEQRRKFEEAYAAKVEKAVDAVARAKGLSAETVEAIKEKVLGVSA